MITRDQIVAEARSWIGTPHVWQAAQKGQGCDCKGLIAGIARELGRPEAESEFARMHDYGRVDVNLLLRGLNALFDPSPQIGHGDVLLLVMNRRPQHLAIADTRAGEIIHTYGRGPEKVTATNTAAAIRLWKLDSCWAWRGVE